MAEEFGHWLVKKLETQDKLKKLSEEKEFLNSTLRILNGLHIGIEEGANPYHFDIDDVEYTEKYVKNMLRDIEKDINDIEHKLSVHKKARNGEVFK